MKSSIQTHGRAEDMKALLGLTWRDVYHGAALADGLTIWSNSLLALADPDLACYAKNNTLTKWDRLVRWYQKWWLWKKTIIVVVYHEEPKIKYRIGYYNPKTGMRQVCTEARYVGDGPFAMRRAPEDCFIFVVAQSKVHLETGNKTCKDMPLY